MFVGHDCLPISPQIHLSCTYDMMYAPPATAFLHDLHFQIPTE
jgi:hypothetical protein